jgi:hypothetical protein
VTHGDGSVRRGRGVRTVSVVRVFWWNLPHPDECGVVTVVVAAGHRGEAVRLLRADGWRMKPHDARHADQAEESAQAALARPGAVLWRRNPPEADEEWQTA